MSAMTSLLVIVSTTITRLDGIVVNLTILFEREASRAGGNRRPRPTDRPCRATLRVAGAACGGAVPGELGIAGRVRPAQRGSGQRCRSRIEGRDGAGGA